MPTNAIAVAGGITLFCPKCKKENLQHVAHLERVEYRLDFYRCSNSDCRHLFCGREDKPYE